MTTLRSTALAAVLVLVQTTAMAADSDMPKPAFLERASADVKKGYELYVSKGCYLCHGRVGQGSPMSGPALARGAPYEYLLHFSRTPTNTMPPYFPEVLSNDDLRRISQYLQALPQDRPVDDIPALRRITTP